MKKYQKTAKDRAWDREREKLNQEISVLHQENANLVRRIDVLVAARARTEEENKKLKEILKELTSKDVKTLLEQYESADKLEKMFHFLVQGGIY